MVTKEDVIALIARQEYLNAQLKAQVMKDPMVNEDTFTVLTNLIRVSGQLSFNTGELLGPEYSRKLQMYQF